MDVVRATRHAALGRAGDLVAHIAAVLELAQELVDGVPAGTAATAQIAYAHLPIVGLRDKRHEQAATRQRQTFVIDGGLVDDEVAPPARRANDGISHSRSRRQ